MISMQIARARTERQRDRKSFEIDFVMRFAVTFIDISPRGATAIAFVRCCLKIPLSGASGEPAIASPTGSMSAKHRDAANAQSQPS